MHWRRYLRSRTNDPSFLWQMVGIVLGLGAAIAYAVQNTSGFLEVMQDIDQRIVSRSQRKTQERGTIPAFHLQIALDINVPAFDVQYAIAVITQLHIAGRGPS